MHKDTKYQYEKRIKSLQEELARANDDLVQYKNLAYDVFNVVTEMVQNDKNINQGWLLNKFKRLFR